jgi:hypothetical protein
MSPILIIKLEYDVVVLNQKSPSDGALPHCVIPLLVQPTLLYPIGIHGPVLIVSSVALTQSSFAGCAQPHTGKPTIIRKKAICA